MPNINKKYQSDLYFLCDILLEMVARRRGTKKSRRSSRRRSRVSMRRRRMGSARRCWSGGANNMSPSPVDGDVMAGPSKMNLAQGGDYNNIHRGQHGGAAVTLGGAPVGDTGMLDDSLRAAARVTPLDQSVGAIQGMSDNPQGGGARRRRGSRRGRKGKKGSRKGKKRGSRSTRRRKSMYGGAAYSLSGAGDAGAPGMLLSPDQEAAALKGMHSDWKTAGDVTLYTPNR